uniref:RRM domain-containing protein n=2 Tax=Macrostomum lignano TaxID=282301 RepID=A0A1I8HY62_9PLAT
QSGSSEDKSGKDGAADFESRLAGRGVGVVAAGHLAELLRAGRLTWAELDGETFAAVSETDFPEPALVSALKEFEESADDLRPGEARTVALNCALKAWRESAMGNAQSASKGPSEASLKRLLQRTGFSHEVTAGQRRYGPPPGRQREPPPPPSCEVFISRLPPDAFEDSLVPLLEEAGPLFDLRIPTEPTSGLNKGFAFALFASPADAIRAAELLNGRRICDFSDSRPLQVEPMAPNCRLLVGNLPKRLSVEQIRSAFKSAGLNGLTGVVCYAAAAAASSNVPSASSQSPASNRGFCFLEFASHADASAAKKRLVKDRGRCVFADCSGGAGDICVDWADAVEEEDRETLNQLRLLLIRNLKPSVTEAELRRRVASFGQLDSVTRTHDLGLVCFRRREDALRAVAELDGVDGLEVSLARRQVPQAVPPPPRQPPQQPQQLMQWQPTSHGGILQLVAQGVKRASGGSGCSFNQKRERRF